MGCFQGPWRLDIGLMVLYQMTLFFSVQMLFVIFLEHMPKTYCTDDDYCYKMRSKCMTDFELKDDSDICPWNMTNFDQCVKEAKRVDFRSAQFDYQQDCIGGLKYFSSSTATFLGTLIGNLVLGYLSDTIGRRPVYIASIVIGVPAVILSAAIDGLLNFYIFRFIVGFAVAGTLTVGWTYGSEMITPSRRFRLRTFPNWANARMMQVGVSYLAGEWRLASYLCAVLSATVLPMIWYLPESPVFLEQKQKYERAEKAREKIAKISQLEYEPKPRDEMKKLKKVTPKKLWRSPTLRRNFLVLCLMWFYVGMTIYITDLNSGDMAKNFYVGQFLCGLVLTVSKILIGLLEPKVSWLGRRLVFIVAQIIAILAYIGILICLWTSSKDTWWYTISYMIAYASQSLCLETCYLSLAELMPTDVRTLAGAVTNILMKVGTILASTTKPIKFWYEPLLFIINLCVCSAGLVVVWKYLQESKNVNIQLVGQDEISEQDDDDEEGDEDGEVEDVEEEDGTSSTKTELTFVEETTSDKTEKTETSEK